jgi:RNA polymerase subunit RPABC4/transcription elongation factor Spt4
MRAPETCPNCGSDVPRNALACPNCGADERTGWSDHADSQRTTDRLGIPDDEFNYDEFVKEEFGELWWAVAVGLALAFAFAYFR